MRTALIVQIAFAAGTLGAPSFARSSDCNIPKVDGIGLFNVADGQALQHSLATNNLSNSPGANFALKALNTQTFNSGTAKVCVTNPFVFSNTHVALSDVASAVNSLLQECGSAG